jgi:3-phytase
MRNSIYVQIVTLLIISSCTSYQLQPDICEVEEYFITSRRPDLNVDSVALWHGPRGEHWLIATAKSGHVLSVYDAVTGEFIKNIGKPGQALGQLQRPNGIAIVDDIVFVIERDNKRMQIFSLPEGKALGMTEGVMQRPYGIDVMRDALGDYIAYVTDNFNADEKFGPKDVHVYRIKNHGGKVAISFVKTFGDREGSGVLHKVESIAIDKAHDRLIIADEYEKQKNIKIYTLDGIFTGQILGAGLIEYEPEGICVYVTGPKDGYIIVTDQDRIGNKFYLFDRQTLVQVGTFKGKIVRNTDGVAVANIPFGPFKSGAFYAVHDDGNICAYDWHTIARTCGLHENQTVE